MKKKTPKKWTLIFLLSAKNNLFNEQLKVINEIYSVRSNKDVDFVILFDAIEGDKFSKKFAAPAIYHVDKEDDFLSDHSIERLSTTSKGLCTKSNLEKLLKTAVKNFPAENYGFFYKGHGAAAKTDLAKGVFDTKMVNVHPKMKEAGIERKFSNAQPGWDLEGFLEYPIITKNGNKDKPVLLIYSKENTEALTYSDMAQVIKKSFRQKPAFICLDCCWGQQIENAESFVGLTDYFIASADQMPALGLGYTQFCKTFVARPKIKAREVANLLVSVFYCTNYADYDSDVPEFRKMGVSLTSLSLAGFESFSKCFTLLCKYLIEKLKSKDDRTFVMISNARSRCMDYTYKNTEKLKASKVDYLMFNIDLIWFLQNLLYYNLDVQLDNKIYDVINHLQTDLIAGFMENNYKKVPPGTRAIGCNGIAICFPVNEEHADESILKGNKIAFYKKTGWKKLIYTYYAYEFDKKKYKAKKDKEFDPLAMDEDLRDDHDHPILKNVKRKSKLKKRSKSSAK